MPSVLVTGASRGIGRETALRLAAAGWDVTAGIRRPEDGAALTAAAGPGGGGSLRTVLLDITDEAQVAALEETLPPVLDAVVNNAGMAVMGPVEAVSPEDLRRQLEVNLVGQHAVTRAVLPRLRASRGRIVFVSSLSGRVATPMTGAYNASKFALEGLADALRLELRPWGVRVSLIEPGSVDTDIWRGAHATADATEAGLSPEHRRLYSKHIAGFRRTIPLMQRTASPASAVAAAIERALTDRRPRARYVVGAANKVQGALLGVTPTPVLDAFLRTGTGVPRKPPAS